VIIDGSPQPFDDSRRAQAAETFQKLSSDGYRTLGVAVLNVEKQDARGGRARYDADTATLTGLGAPAPRPGRRSSARKFSVLSSRLALPALAGWYEWEDVGPAENSEQSSEA
jgi:hypothetical protein